MRWNEIEYFDFLSNCVTRGRPRLMPSTLTVVPSQAGEARAMSTASGTSMVTLRYTSHVAHTVKIKKVPTKASRTGTARGRRDSAGASGVSVIVMLLLAGFEPDTINYRQIILWSCKPIMCGRYTLIRLA